jgi:hypothetical protein
MEKIQKIFLNSKIENGGCIQYGGENFKKDNSSKKNFFAVFSD